MPIACSGSCLRETPEDLLAAAADPRYRGRPASRMRRRQSAPVLRSPCSLRYLLTNRSTGVVQSRQTTSGTAGRASASGASHFGFAAADVIVSRAPSSIQRRIVAISPAESAGLPSGIGGAHLARDSHASGGFPPSRPA